MSWMLAPTGGTRVESCIPPGKHTFPDSMRGRCAWERLGVALGGSWHLGRKGMLLAMSLEPGGGAAFLVAGATEFSAQSLVEWSTSLQMAWGYKGCLPVKQCR